MTKNENLVEGIMSDYKSAPISPKDRALLDFAAKLTREPWTSAETDVAALREAGCSDCAILDVTLVVAYFNFVNRLAQGLGVSLEGSEPLG